MTPSAKISKARAGLILDQPFFGRLALELRLTMDKAADTLWTDGETLGYNPEFVAGLSMEELKGVLAHEVLHLAAAHQARRGARDPKLWNRAGDLAINPLLEDAGFRLPAGRLLDPALRDKSAEEIYGTFPQGSGDQGGGQGSGDSDAGGGDPGDRGGADPGGCGEVRDAPGKDGGRASSGDLAESAEKWKIAVTQAMTQARAMGVVPAGMERWVQEILAPKVDWRAALRRFVSSAARNDYRWFPPNRRFIHAGLYLPGVRSEELGDVVIAVDTSGSIGAAEVEQFAGEVNSILEEHDATATVIYCDAAIAGVEVFRKDDLPLQLTPVGGGGTDFRPPFAWVDENEILPKVFIYLTDLECDAFPEEPPYPVLWAKIGTWGETPPFGEILEVS